jgi:hypothetical protein
MQETDCPVVCSLSTKEFRERRSDILKKIVPAVIETKELKNGFAFSFPTNDDWLLELMQFILFERECCPFLNFKLIIEADHSSVWLELTGREGTKEFISSLIN